jgi:hypothetical protein
LAPSQLLIKNLISKRVQKQHMLSRWSLETLILQRRLRWFGHIQ